MLEDMASQWKTLQDRFSKVAEKLVINEATKRIQQLQQSPTLKKGIGLGVRFGLEALNASLALANPEVSTGRPITETSVPTAARARRIVYSPSLDGKADPGEVVWTWVVYEDDPTQGKDRPVLVVGRNRSTLLGLMLSSKEHHGDDKNWIGIGSGDWDYEGRASWVRLDRVLDVPEEGIRREGAIMPRETFDIVATRLRAQYSWS